MPTSRPGSEPVEFWVDGSRRDGTVEEFYTLSSELGRSVPHEPRTNMQDSHCGSNKFGLKVICDFK